MQLKNSKLLFSVSLGIGMLASMTFTMPAMAANIESNATIDFNTTSEYGSVATPVVVDSEGNLLIKENPLDDSKAIGKMSLGSAVEITRKEDDWTKVKSGDIEGWVKTSDVVTGYEMEAYIVNNSELFNRTATVNCENVTIENENGTGDVVAILKENDEVTIVSETEDYFYVKADKSTGYLSKQTVSENDIDFTEAENIVDETVEEAAEVNEVSNFNYKTYQMLPYNTDTTNGYTPNDETEIRKSMIDYSMQFLGNPYVYGGTSMTNGVDCSAFTQNIYRQYGYALPRTAAEQATVGREIDQSELRPGDLLFYWDSGRGKIGHVTMYIGNNMVIHASNHTDGIIISNAYYRQPCSIRRYIED